MKIKDIITERNNPNPVGNDKAKISRSSKEATKQFKDADKGTTRSDNVQALLGKVRAMYGMELVDDFIDVLELPNGEEGTDNAESLFSDDNRKK